MDIIGWIVGQSQANSRSRALGDREQPVNWHFSWPYENTQEALARNIEGVKAAGEISAPLVRHAMSYAEKVGLNIDWHDPAATPSKLAVIIQTPKEFGFPGMSWPAQFHYTFRNAVNCHQARAFAWCGMAWQGFWPRTLMGDHKTTHILVHGACHGSRC